ncbi:intraflagellar transport protein 20 [Pycnococcus provasolii]
MDDSGGGGAISFDDNFHIRVLDAEKFKQTRDLQESSTAFSKKVTELSDAVSRVLTAVDTQASRIEKEKLRAVGARIKANAEADLTRRRAKDERQLLSERREELERLNTEYESLCRVKQDQQRLIAKLSAGGQ